MREDRQKPTRSMFLRGFVGTFVALGVACLVAILLHEDPPTAGSMDKRPAPAPPISTPDAGAESPDLKMRLLSSPKASGEIPANDGTPNSPTNTLVEAEPPSKPDTGILFKSESFFTIRVILSGSLLETLIALQPDNLRLSRVLASGAEEVLLHRMDPRKQMADGDAVTLVFKEGSGEAIAPLYGLRYDSRILDRVIWAYAFWEQGRPEPEFFDDRGIALKARLRKPPIPAYRRIGRLAGKTPALSGLDFIEVDGKDVVTPFKSRVERINWLPKEEGRCLELSYLGTGVGATFTGLLSLSVKVNPGAELDAGAVIGRAGRLSRSGVGLHYFVHRGIGENAPRIDPFHFHGTEVYELAETETGAFARVKQRIDSLFRDAEQRAAIIP